MFMTSVNESYAIRPPWPDELDRMSVLLSVREELRSPWLWALAIGNPERLVGAAALEVPIDGHGSSRLRLALRPRFRASSPGESLMRRAVEKARELGGLPIVYQSSVDQAPRKLLERVGFVPVRREQLWQLAVSASHQRTMKIVKGMSKRLERLGVVWHGPPSLEHMPEILKILQAHGLRDGSPIRFSDEITHEMSASELKTPATKRIVSLDHPASEDIFDRDFSSIVQVNGRVVAVVLTKDIGSYRVFTQYRAVDPEFMPHSATINPLLMSHPLAAFVARGKRYVLITAREGAQDETIHMAQKSDGRLLSATEIFQLTG
jgi:N-acetylglutamate synthase-like GNAT family acetyltransferase